MALERISKVTSLGVSTTISIKSIGITVAGIVTATSFVGDGSGLTGVVGSGSGIIVKDDNTTVGTAGTINFGSNLSVSAISAGIVTVTGTDTNTTYTQAAVADGSNVNLRLTGSDSTTDDILLTAGTNITFSSVTAGGLTISASGGGGGSTAGIDTTGTSTFTNLNVTGVSTFAGITTVTGPTLFAKQLNVSGVVTASSFVGALTGNVTGNATGLSGTPNITVGTIGATSLNASGVVTATSFSGSASGLTGIPAGQLTGNLPAIDGSALINVIGSGSGVIVRDSGTIVGTAGTIDFGDNLTVSAVSAGIVTVTASGGGSIAGINTSGTSIFTNLNVTGVTTSTGGFVGNVTGNATGLSGTPNITVGTIAATSLNASGVVTATTFSGALTGNVTGNVTGNATGLSGTPNITVGTIAATSLNASGVVTATTFSGALTGNVTGNVTGNATGLSGTPNITVGTIAATSLNASGVVTATSFSGSGINLTGIVTSIASGSGISIDQSTGKVTITASGGSSIAGINTSGTSTFNNLNVTGVSTVGVVTGATYFGDGSRIVSGRWILGASAGNNGYTFTGIGFTETTEDPILYLERGAVYEFVNNMGAHPFRIQSTPNGSTGTQYDNGVTNNNVSNGTLRFEVPFNAPSILYYQCTAHSNMGGTINILEESRFLTTAAGIHTLSNVGIGTTNPQTKLQVERYGIKTGLGTFNASAGIATDVDTFTISTTDFKTAEYTLHLIHSSNIQAQKVLVMQNGTTAYSQEYGVMSEPNLIVSVGATISSGVCKLQVTPETGISGLTTYRFTRQTML